MAVKFSDHEKNVTEATQSVMLLKRGKRESVKESERKRGPF